MFQVRFEWFNVISKVLRINSNHNKKATWQAVIKFSRNHVHTQSYQFQRRSTDSYVAI